MAPATRDRFGFLQQQQQQPALDTDTIGVIVRVRPLSEKEAARGEGVAVEVHDDGKTVLVRKFLVSLFLFFKNFPRNPDPVVNPGLS